jgi:hypothetical protein
MGELQEDRVPMPYFHCPACGVTSHSTAAYFTPSVCANCSAPLDEDARLELGISSRGIDRQLTAADARPPAPAGHGRAWRRW